MVLKVQILCFILLSGLHWNITKQEFYSVLKEDRIQKINQMIQKVEKQNANASLKNAYKGALLMKKAGILEGSPGRKMEVFKQGSALLEKEIDKHPNNVEYRFLRLSIQENAPKILRYYKNIKADKTLIANKYSGLDKELKIVIKAYTRKSKYLATNDLK